MNFNATSAQSSVVDGNVKRPKSIFDKQYKKLKNMKNEVIILLIATLLSIGIFFLRYKWKSFNSNIPDPWFSIILSFLLFSLIVLSVTIYNSNYFSEDIKDFMKFIPILAMIVEIRFRTKNKELK